jgi:hypothetical protein
MTEVIVTYSILGQSVLLKLGALALATITLAVGAPAWSAPRYDDGRLPDLGDCQRLKVQPGNKVAFQVVGVGVQIYRWDGDEWIFVAPDASLYADAGLNGLVGTHFGGPTWKSLSGSQVVGSVVDKCTVDPDSIDWLLLRAASTTGPGIFQDVTFIQRLNTKGGLAPDEPGEFVGDEANVPYSADYVFYRKAGTTRPAIFSVGGDATTASIQAKVDEFRTALGAPNNANAAGPLKFGHREINWDGGGSTATSPGPTPFNVFLNNRGAQFTTPGTGFLQAPASGGANGGLATVFSKPAYGTDFTAFSPTRLFVPVGSNVTDAVFFIPGSNGAVRAGVRGFGAVFTDVDLAHSTRLEFFDVNDEPMGEYEVPAGTTANGSMSFLGVFFNDRELIGRVRITSGNAPLGVDDDPENDIDIVAMDDFFYSEPVAIPAP